MRSPEIATHPATAPGARSLVRLQGDWTLRALSAGLRSFREQLASRRDDVAWSLTGISRLDSFGAALLDLDQPWKVLARTRDHSRIRILLDEGLISEAMAATHPDRNKIYSCLGSPNPPEIEFSRKTPLEQGDVVLL